jgi:hypothetical protein
MQLIMNNNFTPFEFEKNFFFCLKYKILYITMNSIIKYTKLEYNEKKGEKKRERER